MEPKKYIKQELYVGEDAIYIPVVPYAEEGSVSIYKPLISKDLFVEAYNKWIKNATAQPSGIVDPAPVAGIYNCSTCNRHDASGNSKSVECLACTCTTGGIPSRWVGKP